MVGEVRINRGRNEKTTFVIVDAQSVKNTDTAEQKGYDAGKKVSGIKRHLAVDTQGLPHAIAVTIADVTDRAGALVAFSEHQDNLSAVKSVLVDGGYTGQPFAAAVRKMLGATVAVAKRNELHTLTVMPKRWVVERSFAWLEKCRRLWKNCERKLNTSLQQASRFSFPRAAWERGSSAPRSASGRSPAFVYTGIKPAGCPVLSGAARKASALSVADS